jgi:hypothetical protein
MRWHVNEEKAIMPASSLSADELSQLISSIIMEGGRHEVERLLEDCHEHKPFGIWSAALLEGARGSHEKYFHKQIAYQDFDVRIPFFRCDGDTVMEAKIQFRRPSRFPSPFLNRSRPLITKLLKLLGPRYGNSKVEVKDDADNALGRQIHFDVTSNSFWWSASTPFEKWESECAIYDEPYSSGQTDPDETNIRNDFVIIRFHRKAAASGCA